MKVTEVSQLTECMRYAKNEASAEGMKSERERRKATMNEVKERSQWNDWKECNGKRGGARRPRPAGRIITVLN